MAFPAVLDAAPSESRSPSPFDDIAATMGFASFGAKPNPPKKRKRADPSNEGSGSNNTPLGAKQRQLGQGVQEYGQKMQVMTQHDGAWTQHEGQQSLEASDNLAGDGLNGTENANFAHGRLRNSAQSLGEDEDDTGPRYIEDDEDEEQLQLPLHHGKPTKSLETNDLSSRDSRPMQDEKEKFKDHRQIRNMGQGHVPGKRADGQWDWHALRKGVRDGRGDVAYYDASFVEDPWAQLRKEKGLS